MQEVFMQLCISKEDADQIERIFYRQDEPDFTIMSRKDFTDAGSTVIDLYVTNSTALWYLAKSVHLHNEHDDWKRKNNISVI